MTESLAERAKLARSTDIEQKKLEAEAEAARKMTEAYALISKQAQVFGIEVLALDIVAKGPSFHTYTTTVTPDLDLVFEVSSLGSKGPKLSVKARPCDQLYWNLPPGELVKGRGGGSYGCFGLNREREIMDLIDLGAAIEQVEKAREAWAKSHTIRGNHVSATDN